MRSTLVLLAASSVLAIAPAEARAEDGAPEPILDLEWNAPPECPGRAQVTARVEELVGHTHAPRTLPARGDITTSPEGPRYRLGLVVGRAPASDRTMSDADCARLAEAAALILALDVDAAARELEHSPSREESAVDEASERTPPAPPRSTRRPPQGERAPLTRRDAVSLSAGLRALLDDGSLPRTTGGVGIVVGIARGSVGVDLHASAYERQFTGGPREGTGGAYVDLAAAGAHACLQSVLDRTGLRACAGGELGRMGTRGVGIAQPGASAAFWGAATLSFEARPLQERVVAPVIGVTFGHPLSAPDVVIRGFGTLFEPPVLFFRTHVGLRVRFF